MRKTVVIVVCVVAGLLLAGGAYWYFLRKNVAPAEAINAVPPDAAIVLEIKNFQEAWTQYLNTATYREQLEKHDIFKLFHENVSFVDSIIKNNEVAAQVFGKRKMYISVHSQPDKSLEYLYCMSLEKVDMKEHLDQIIRAAVREDALFRNFEYGNTIVTSVKKSETDSAFYYTQYQGIFISSYSLLLTESAIDQLNKGGSLLKDNYFVKATGSAGKNVEMNIYINYKRFPAYLRPFLKSENSAKMFADLAAWSELDMSLRPEGFMLNGFTYTNDTAAHYLNLFTAQKPQETAFPAVLPGNTATFIFFGISDILSFYSDYKTHLKKINDLERYEQEVKNINTTYDVDIEMSMFSWMGNEFGVCITEPKTPSFSENTFAVFKARRTELANELLTDLVKKLAAKQGEAEKEIYHDYTITNINLPEVLPRLFGSTFDQMKSTYYTMIDDYVIFGNNIPAVKNFINFYIADKTLGKDVYFNSFSENLSSTFNVFVYSNPSRSQNIIDSYVNSETMSTLRKSDETIKKFEGAALQLSSNGSAFYTNFYTRYNEDYSGTKANVFEARLDTTVSSKPVFLKNAFSGEREVFVQDDANTIYLISSMGTILWKKQLPEKINGEVYQVSALKNEKLQILFGTTNFIYMLDRKGEDVGKFPLELESPATCPLSVFDYDNNRNYRLFISCKNKKVYCYDSNGENVKGWSFNKTKDIISQPILHLREGKTDYIVIADEAGKVNILDRRGKDKAKVKEKIPFAANRLQAGKSGKGIYLAVTDSTGKVYIISTGGKVETVSPKEFSARHSFVYADINSDNEPELLFSDLNELSVYSKKGEALFTHKFNTESKLPPLVADTWDGKRPGAVSGAGEVYIFTAKGEIEEDFPVTGSTLFDVSPGINDQPSLLVTGLGNSVLIYTLE